MLDFIFALRLFYILLATSVLAVGVLLLSYQRERQNLLLRSCCLIVLIMYGVIVAGHIHHQGRADIKDAFCETQAIFLNYCYICIHAHACFMMLNNCYVAMGWKLGIFERHIDRESSLTLLAYSIPMLYVALLAFLTTNSVSGVLILPGPFFCSIVNPRFILSTMWFMLFSIPGSALSVYLLYKTWRARQRTLIFGSATQLTVPYLARLTLSTFVYICLSFGSFIPLLIIGSIEEKAVDGVIGFGGPLQSPWLNPGICQAYSGDPVLQYFAGVLCPGLLSYFPVIIGISSFLMYGFGAHARAAYQQFLNKFLRARRRRNSSLPLIDGLSTSGAVVPEMEIAEHPYPAPISSPLAVIEELDSDGASSATDVAI